MKFSKYLILHVFFAFCGNLFAQENLQIIELYQGKAPGSENWTWEEGLIKNEFVEDVYNVVDPTLTVYLPDKSNARDIGIIICAGGGFHFQGMSLVKDVAKYLNERGIVAFVLKYRLVHTLSDNPYSEMPQNDQNETDVIPASIIQMGVDDAKTAIKYVKNNANQWNINPDRIGIMGFSAGGTLAIASAFSDSIDTRPNFVAPIYPYIGFVKDMKIPEDAPPLFTAAASNDNLGFHKGCIDLYQMWNNANGSAEIHIYRKGGHGFGIRKMNYPTFSFIDRFYEWLNSLYPQKNKDEDA